jgi:hypothetical protein
LQLRVYDRFVSESTKLLAQSNKHGRIVPRIVSIVSLCKASSSIDERVWYRGGDWNLDSCASLLFHSWRVLVVVRGPSLRVQVDGMAMCV